VLKDGVVMFPEEIYRAYGIEPFGSRPRVRMPPATNTAGPTPGKAG